jgi:hypothetical protein
MAGRTQTLRIGLIAEDRTDCETVTVLIRRVAEVQIGIDQYPADGCGTLRRKAARWLGLMAGDGCEAAVVVHDLDRDPHNNELNDVGALRRRLAEIAVPTGLRRLICIPIEELEAWFWSDPVLIERVGRGRGKAIASPHSIQRPKERLQRLSAEANGKPRYNTNHNVELARSLDLERCALLCPSFRELREFVRGLVGV